LINNNKINENRGFFKKKEKMLAIARYLYIIFVQYTVNSLFSVGIKMRLILT